MAMAVAGRVHTGACRSCWEASDAAKRAEILAQVGVERAPEREQRKRSRDRLRVSKDDRRAADPARRQAAPVDPEVLARLAAEYRRNGRVPPRECELA